jgi:DNA-binding beta-propeller fold protein YncE
LAHSAGAQEQVPTTLVFPPFEHTLGFRKATGIHLKLLLGPRAYFQDPQGLAAVKLRSWDNRKSTDDDDELTVYGVNSGRHQIIFNTSMRSLGTFGKEGSGDGQLRLPRGIAADPQGNVYVADTGNERIVRLYNPRKKLQFVRNIGVGILKEPHQVALDSRGRIYVTDHARNRVCVFDSVGHMLRFFPGPETPAPVLLSPEGVAVTDAGELWSHYRENALYISDSSNHRIQKLSLEGQPRAMVRGADFDRPEATFCYLAVDYYGNLYATDSVNHQVHKFDRDLKFLTSFGRRGRGDREFESPRGIAIWRRFGQVFIAEGEGAQYYWIGVDGYLRGAFPPQFTEDRPGSTIALLLTDPAEVHLEVFDSTGSPVRDLMPQFRQFPGENDIVWNGLDEYGSLVGPGEYTIVVEIEPTYSSKGTFKKRLVTKVRRL